MRDTSGIKEYIKSLRTECNRCGADNPDVLVFHHTHPETKTCDIGPHLTKERIDKELLNCEIVCFNCHMILHRKLKTTRRVKTRQKMSSELSLLGSNIARGKCLNASLSKLPPSLLEDIRKEINHIIPLPKKPTPVIVPTPERGYLIPNYLPRFTL